VKQPGRYYGRGFSRRKKQKRLNEHFRKEKISCTMNLANGKAMTIKKTYKRKP
jgi:hypothetical protein